MKRRDTLMRLKRFRVDELKRRMATLDGMRADLDRKLTDLEDSVARERQRANDSDIGRLAFPSFLRSIESRRENLKNTLKEIDREREQGRESEMLAGLPATPVNGHAVPSYAESQAIKEYHLSELRGIEVEIKRRQLFPIEPLRAILFAGAHYLQNRLGSLPGELSGQLGPELTKLLHFHIAAAFNEARRVVCWESVRHGISPPPDPPPAPLRKRLAYYEQFIRNSRAGEIESVDAAQQIGSVEWLRLHPSVSFQESFKYSALKKEWDARMSQLLAERSSWDLPPELPEEPPPEPPEEEPPHAT